MTNEPNPSTTLDACIRKLVDEAPPLTDAQRQTLAAIFTSARIKEK